MCGNDNYQEMIENAKGKDFTMMEAIAFMKELDKGPTGTNTQVRWVKKGTNEPVNFAYTYES